MKRAVEEVKNGRSVREVARALQINRTTLSRYVKKSLALQNGSSDDFLPHFNTRQVCFFKNLMKTIYIALFTCEISKFKYVYCCDFQWSMYVGRD